MGPGRNANTGKFQEQDEDTPRQLRALELRRKGLSYRRIGEEMGTSEATAFRDVQAVLKRTEEAAKETADEVRKLELERIDSALAQVHDILAGTVDVSGLDPEGDIRAEEVIARALELKLKAVDRLVKLQERRAKLLGLDAASKVEHSGPEGAPIPIGVHDALGSKLGQLAERLTGGTAGAAAESSKE